jgi:hypothetical protein
MTTPTNGDLPTPPPNPIDVFHHNLSVTINAALNSGIDLGFVVHTLDIQNHQLKNRLISAGTVKSAIIKSNILPPGGRG